jgi:predicted aldo/keto reductase-like oxidoreductase
MIALRPFGRTGHRSSCTILGGAAFWSTSQKESDSTLETAFALGVNHIDTAANYGESEKRIGSWIRRHGKTFFLGTKTEERTAAAARDEIQRSLERLHVDQVDLLQLHNLVNTQEWETALGPGGALEAAVAAREQGLVRFIGVTGHGLAAPAMHKRSLERFAFDSVLVPLNYVLVQNAQYRRDIRALLSTCRSRGVAVQTIKAIVRGPWTQRPPGAPTWYEPLTEQADIDLAVHWLLSHRSVFLNTAGDTQLMPRILNAASRFHTAPADSEMRALVTRLGMTSLFV